MDTTGRARQLDEAAPGPGYPTTTGVMIEADELSFWTAGSEPHRLPEGIGIRVPAQADIVLQVHYHPSGKATEDRTRVGMYFSKKPVKQAMHWASASNFSFNLPAGRATSRSRRTGSSRSTSRHSPSARTCTSSGRTCRSR